MNEFSLWKKCKSDFNKCTGLLLIYIFLSLVLGMGLGSFIGYLPVSFLHKLVLMMLAVYLLSLFVIVIVFLIGKAWLKVPLGKLFRNKISFKTWGLSTSFMFGTSFFVAYFVNLVNLLLSRLFGVSMSGSSLELGPFSFSTFLILIYVVVLGPLFEELLFRGLILRTLDKYHRGFAVLVSSLLFGMLHMNLQQGIVTFAVGCVLGYVSLKHDSLLLPIGMHIANNLVMVLITYLSWPVLWCFFYLFCVIMMMISLSKEERSIHQLFQKEYCTYPYGKLFFSRWTTILFLAVFVIMAIFGSGT